MVHAALGPDRPGRAVLSRSAIAGPVRKLQASADLSYARIVEWYQPDRFRHLEAVLADGPRSVQGAGLSIAPCSFGERAAVVNLSKFDRILAFDPAAGTLEVEAGASLAKVFAFLEPRGYWLAAQPGYPAISIGGCIAAHVHGKDHHRHGAFGRWVVSLRLFHPDHGLLILGGDEHPDLFELTCGGYGLTGAIVSAVLRVAPLRGNCVDLERVPVRSLSETADVLLRLEPASDILYTWNDLAHFDARLGRGCVVAGTLGTVAAPPRVRIRPGSLNPSGRTLRLPLLNNRTLGPVSSVYQAVMTRARRRRVAAFAALFPFVSATGYWNAFGRRGLLESQVLVPFPVLRGYVAAMERVLRKVRQPAAVAYAKVFRGTSRLLRFDGTGLCLTLQVPRTSAASRLLADLDAVNIEFGAISNLNKDSRLPAEVARRQYPQFEEFVARLRAFDPRRRFSTALSERLGL